MVPTLPPVRQVSPPIVGTPGRVEEDAVKAAVKEYLQGEGLTFVSRGGANAVSTSTRVIQMAGAISWKPRVAWRCNRNR